MIPWYNSPSPKSLFRRCNCFCRSFTWCTWSTGGRHGFFGVFGVRGPPCLAIRICESLCHPGAPRVALSKRIDATRCVGWLWRVFYGWNHYLGCYSSTSSIRSEVDYVTPTLLVLILLLNFLTRNPDPSICRLCLSTWQAVGNVR